MIFFNTQTPEGQQQLQKDGVECDPTPYCYGSIDEVKEAVNQEERRLDAEQKDFEEQFSKAFGSNQESGGILGGIFRLFS